MVFRPIGELLPGLEIEDLEDGDIAVDAIVLIKVVNPDDVKPGWYQRATPGLTAMESLGALTAAQGTERDALVDSFRRDEEDG